MAGRRRRFVEPAERDFRGIGQRAQRLGLIGGTFELMLPMGTIDVKRWDAPMINSLPIESDTIFVSG